MVKKYYYIIFSAFIFYVMSFTCSLCFAQSNNDIEFIISHNPINTINEKTKIILDETSEIKIISMGLIRFYQSFISSQHNSKNVCIFTPSCSNFGYTAIKKYGFVFGALMASDRIQRCNGLSNAMYPSDTKTGRIADPIEKYHYKKNSF